VAGEDLFRSADGGASWGKAGGTLPRPVRAVALDREDAGVLYAAAGRGVFRSTDGGGRWIGLGTGSLEAALGPASEAEADVAVTSVAVSGRRILATARLRLSSGAPLAVTVVSPDAGKSWTRLTRAVEAPLVWDSGDTESGRLFAAVPGKALSTADDGASWVSVGDEERPIAAVLAVESDWPGRIWGTAADGTLTRVDARCASGPAALCLRGGRFRIEVEWEKPVGGGDALRAEPMSDDSRAFSLGRASNVLLTVQIRDARAANGHFWVDVDARTIRGFSLLVTDLGRGATMRYSHPEGQRTKFSDHEAF